MARDIRFSGIFPGGEYSNIAENNGSRLSQNKGHIQSVTDVDTFRCRSCLFEQELRTARRKCRLCFDAFSSGSEHIPGQIFYRRPRLVRGLYLGKEPLDYQKPKTPFRFSFQKPNEEIVDIVNDKVKASEKKIIFPKSMIVELCNLQRRPSLRCKKLKQDRVQINSDVKAFSVPAASGVLDEYPRKQVPLLPAIKDCKLNVADLKEEEKVKLKGKLSPLTEKSTVKNKEAGLFKGVYLKSKKVGNLQFGTGACQVKELTDYTGTNLAEFYLQNGTFQFDEYDIWARTNKTF